MLEAFARHMLDDGLAARSVAGYVEDVHHFGAWFEQTNGQALAAGALTAADVREYREWLLSRQASPATVNRRLAALRRFGEWAVHTGAAPDNPAAAVRGVRQQAHAPRWLDGRAMGAILREAARAYQAARTESGRRLAVRDRALLTLLLNSGLRIGEACALTLGDLEIRDRSGRVIVRRGKGDKQRAVPLNLNARRALAAWLAVRPALGEHVFIGRQGEALQPRGVQRMLARLCRRAGVEASPHVLRHTFAHELVRAGVRLDEVADLMGHTSLNTTRIYTRASEAELARAVSVLE